MKSLSKRVLAGTTAALAAVATALVAPTAMADGFEAKVEGAYVALDSATVTVTGCPDGATVKATASGLDMETTEWEVADGQVKFQVTPQQFKQAGETRITLTCNPAEGEPSTTEATLVGYGRDVFDSDKGVTERGAKRMITVGDFIPGYEVKLVAYPEGTKETPAYEQSMGEAGADFLAKAEVAFPESMPCGTYDVYAVGERGDLEPLAPVKLTTCSTNATNTPTPSASADAPVEGGAPVAPALPKTGN